MTGCFSGNSSESTHLRKPASVQASRGMCKTKSWSSSPLKNTGATEGRSAVAMMPKLTGVSSKMQGTTSRQHLLDHMPMHIGKPALDAVVVEAQAFMVQAQQVQDRRVQVVDCRRRRDGAVAKFIRRAEAEAALDA